jgi:hypothetical protein
VMAPAAAAVSGFGAGSALTVIPIANMIQSSGYQAAFLWFRASWWSWSRCCCVPRRIDSVACEFPFRT